VALLALTASLLFAKWMVLAQAGDAREEYLGSARSYTLALALVMAFGLVGRGLRLARFFAAASAHPARMMALSFGLTGVLGALLLSLPMCLESVRSASLVDNLFMAFSAVCVTGLSVHSVPETYNVVGQFVLCALVQVGGLGIMVLSAALVMLAGQRLRVKSSAVLAEMVDASSIASLRRTIGVICLYTMLIEGAGAALLYLQFQAYPDVAHRFGDGSAGAGSHAWAAIFHAVSGFCNAGFSNMSAGLLPFAGHPGIMLVMVLLIVLGGIGFPVLDEAGRALFTRLRGRRVPTFSLHSRVALRTTGLLLGGMTVAYLLLEWTASMRDQGYFARLYAALFQSASARTAGFNVIDIGVMRPATLVLTCAAMFVGACPGSTAGGIKTTTLAVLFSGLRSELSARPPHLLDRTIAQPVIRRAIGVAFLSMVIVLTGFFLLLLVEPHPPLELAFEVVSAFSTTGLSTGVTPKLSTAGKLLIICMMFIGRIGPLTLALTVSVKPQRARVQLPEERVMIG
jgi:trk system potassium uptake protein TrkH